MIFLFNEIDYVCSLSLSLSLSLSVIVGLCAYIFQCLCALGTLAFHVNLHEGREGILCMGYMDSPSHSMCPIQCGVHMM